MPTSALLYGLFSVALLAAPLNAALTGRIGPPDAEGERILKALQTTTLRLLRSSYRQAILVLVVLCSASLLQSFLSDTSLTPAFFAPLIGALLVCLGSYWWMSRVFIAAAQEISARTNFDALSFRTRAAGLATLPVVGAFGLACLSTLSFSSSSRESLTLLLSLAGGGVATGIVLSKNLLLIKGGVPREVPSHLADPTALVRSSADLGFSALRSCILQLAAAALVLGNIQLIDNGTNARELTLIAALGPLLAILGSLITSAHNPLQQGRSWFTTTAILFGLALIGTWQLSFSATERIVIGVGVCAVGLSSLTHLLPLLVNRSELQKHPSFIFPLTWSLAPPCLAVIVYRMELISGSAGQSDALLGASFAAGALLFLPWSYLGRTTQILTALHPALMTMRGDSVGRVNEADAELDRSSISGLPLLLVAITSLLAMSLITINAPANHNTLFTGACILVAILTAGACSVSLRLVNQQDKLLEKNSNSSLKYQKSVQFQGSQSPDLSAPITDSLKAQSQSTNGHIYLLLCPVVAGTLIHVFKLSLLSTTLAIAGVAAGIILVFFAWFLNSTPWRIRLSSQLLTLIGMHFILWIPMVAQHS